MAFPGAMGQGHTNSTDQRLQQRRLSSFIATLKRADICCIA